jgi:hypothetical protein
MKITFSIWLLLSILLPACAGGPGDDEVTVKRSERQRDGQVVRTTERFYRKGSLILTTVKTLNSNGNWNTSRLFRIDKQTTFCESDEDGDGHFETVMINYGSKRSLEAFERSTDGSVVPLSSAKLKALNKQTAVLRKFFEKEIGKDK